MALAVVSMLLSCTPADPKIAFKAAERRGRLEKNGLRFVIMPDPTTDMIEVDVRYMVGSREDPPGKAGLAHLVEHLMFQQRPDGPNTKPLMSFIMQNAVNMNAWTKTDATHYMINARKEELDAMIKIEAMRMHYGCQTISEAEFERERDVVRNEIRLRGARTPEGQIPRLVLQNIYPEGHPYREDTGGNDEQIAHLTLADACQFMKNYYTPDRAVLIVAGGVEVDPTVASIEKWFSGVEKRTPAPRRVVPPIHLQREKKVIDLDIERPYLAVAWALPDETTDEGELAQFGVWNAFSEAAMLGNKYNCAVSTQPFPAGGEHAPAFVILMELKSYDKADECIDLIMKAAKSAHRGYDMVPELQVDEIKNRQKAQFISRLEPLFGGRGEVMGDLVEYTHDFDFDSTDLYVFHQLDKIGKFDPGKIGSIVNRVLDPDKAHIVLFKPSKAGSHGDKRAKVAFHAKSHDQMEQPDVDPREAHRPFRVATELKSLQGAVRYQLDNGMNVVLLAIDSFPVISAELIFDVGESATPDNPQLASAAADFLSGPMDSEAVGRTGVRMGCRATPDHTICGARGMNVYLDVVVKGLERLIKAGTYHQEGIENWQKRVKLALKLRRSQQKLEFQRQQLAAIFGPDHAYTKTGAPAPDTVGGVGRDKLNDFRNTHYSAANATLVIAGSFDIEKAKSLIGGSFGHWGKGHKDEPVAATPYKRTGPAYVGVIGDEDPQMDLAILYPSPAGIDGQQAARLVLAGMVNDAMWDIRTKLGTTYGIYARRDNRLGPSFYDMGGTVDALRAGESLKAMRDGIDDLRKGGVDFDTKFVRARRKIIQQLLGESTMSASLAQRLGLIAQYHLGPNYYNQLLQQVAAVSLAQVKALLATELDPKNEVVVVLGDRNAVNKAFEVAGITDVKLVEPDYK